MWKGLALGTAALGTGLLLRSEYEKNHFLVEELAIDSPKIQKEHRFIFILRMCMIKSLGRETAGFLRQSGR